MQRNGATTLFFIAKIRVASAMETITRVPVQSSLQLVKKRSWESRNSPLVISASCTTTCRKTSSNSQRQRLDGSALIVYPAFTVGTRRSFRLFTITAAAWPTNGRQTGDSRLTDFSGSSTSQLPNYCCNASLIQCSSDISKHRIRVLYMHILSIRIC